LEKAALKSRKKTTVLGVGRDKGTKCFVLNKRQISEEHHEITRGIRVLERTILLAGLPLELQEIGKYELLNLRGSAIHGLSNPE
jgi:hypothetical protein